MTVSPTQAGPAAALPRPTRPTAGSIGPPPQAPEIWLGGAVSADVYSRTNARHEALGSRKLETRKDLLDRLKRLVAKIHRALGRRVGEHSDARLDRVKDAFQLGEALSFHPPGPAHGQRPGHRAARGRELESPEVRSAPPWGCTRDRARPCRSGAAWRSSARGRRSSRATARSSPRSGRSRTAPGTSRPASPGPRR